MPSFDVVSKVDMQEVDNAINQTRKEIETRYDFRGGKSKLDFEKDKIIIHADDDMKLKAITEILNQKMVKRGVGYRALDYQEAEKATGDTLRQTVLIKQGISQESGKNIIKIVKNLGIKKVQAQIQDDQVRVTGPKRDDLQAVIAALKTEVKDLDLQFVNFRD